MSTGSVAVIGRLGARLEGNVLRCERWQLALEAEAALVMMQERDWQNANAEMPANARCAVVIATASRELYGAYLRDPRIRHLLFESPRLSAELEQTAAIASGSKAQVASSLGLPRCGFEAHLLSSEQQAEIALEAAAFAKTAGARGRAAQNWLDALSEAITNALYSAPREGEHAPYQLLHRREAVELTPKHALEVRLFSTDEHLAFSVADAFGSLRASEFFGALGRTLTSGQAQVSNKTGGAGLGLMMMFDRLERLVAMVERGRRTCIVGVAPLTNPAAGQKGRTVQYFSG